MLLTRGWFIIDLVAAIPFDLLLFGSDTDEVTIVFIIAINITIGIIMIVTWRKVTIHLNWNLFSLTISGARTLHFHTYNSSFLKNIRGQRKNYKAGAKFYSDASLSSNM